MTYRVFIAHVTEKVPDRPGVRKSRVGGWRILFTVDRDEKVVNVAAVNTRGQVYKHS